MHGIPEKANEDVLEQSKTFGSTMGKKITDCLIVDCNIIKRAMPKTLLIRKTQVIVP